MIAALHDLSIVYEDTGPATRSPVVFLHGFPLNRHMWNPQWEAYAKTYRLLRFDQRGHGETGPGDGQFTIEFMVDDLIGLLDELHVQKAVLCGLSMGGYVALRAVERHLDRFMGLVLCDTRSEGDTDRSRILRSSAIKTIKDKGINEFVGPFLESLFAEETRLHHPELVESIRSSIHTSSPLGLCGALLAMAGRTDTTAMLASIRIPTLILVGERDRLTPPDQAQALHERIPGSSFAVIPKAGHLSNLENPASFNHHLGHFLKSLSI